MKCLVCEGNTRKASDLEFKVSYEGRDIIITNLSGELCPECGESYYDLSASERIDKAMQKYWQPSIKFKRKITTSGERKVIGIPKEVEEALKIEGGEEVQISLEGRKIISEIASRIGRHRRARSK